MKRVLSLMLTLAMVFVLAVPCFAAEAKVEPRSSATKYVYDDNGNRYKVTGNSYYSGYMGNAYTSFSLTNYGGGDKASLNGITETVTVSANVYFSDGTTPNYTALSGSSNFTEKTSGSVSKSKDFTAPPTSIYGTHTFTTNKGGYISFNAGM